MFVSKFVFVFTFWRYWFIMFGDGANVQILESQCLVQRIICSKVILNKFDVTDLIAIKCYILLYVWLDGWVATSPILHTVLSLMIADYHEIIFQEIPCVRRGTLYFKVDKVYSLRTASHATQLCYQITDVATLCIIPSRILMLGLVSLLSNYLSVHGAWMLLGTR